LSQELDVPISIDTTKDLVARATLEAGAHIINDISGLKAEPEIAATAARYGAAVILMHRQGDPRQMQDSPRYHDLIGDILLYLREGVTEALARGLSLSNLAIDPGIGFGKTVEHNLEILRLLPEFKVLGLPLLVGTSRKSLIGKVLDLPVHERVEGTAATVALSIAGGADFVRVHDVKERARVARMSDAVVRRT
jgi:dihydropteroate synthase